MVYLETVSRKKKDFRGVTIWKYPPTSDAEKMLNAAFDPEVNGQNRLGAYTDNNTPQHGNQDTVLTTLQEAVEKAIGEEKCTAYSLD